MTNSKILVTSYQDPDLDGSACSFAYAEYLQKKGKDAIAVTFGNLQLETEFIIAEKQMTKPLQGESVITPESPVILVDASDTIGIAKTIHPQQVIEIIDHRKINESHAFPNAKVQIDLVGSAATLIAEKFYTEKIQISKAAAVLLFSAIISNTIHFKATVTTDRDKQMAAWLQTNCTIPENFIHNMFAAKSVFTKPLQEIFEQVFALITLQDTKIGIVQLEMIDVLGFIAGHKLEIEKVLELMKKEKSLDMIFLTAVGIEKATNTFLAIDNQTQNLLEKSLEISFKNNIAQRNGILMRKQIVPILKSFLFH